LYPGDFIPESRAKSSRNAERHQIGMVREIIPESRATSVGISKPRGGAGIGPSSAKDGISALLGHRYPGSPAVPEPSSFLLFVTGMFVVTGLGRWLRHSS
ncbi:MAG: PEP-CTERM sorting domain-containing protein, partial [Stellaceae bacterium]